MLTLFFCTRLPPPNSHLKPPGRCPISASHFPKRFASHRIGKNHCGNFRSSAPQPPRSVNGQPCLERERELLTLGDSESPPGGVHVPAAVASQHCGARGLTQLTSFLPTRCGPQSGAHKVRDRCKWVFPEGVLGTKCRKLVALIALSHFCLRFGFLSRNLLLITGRKVSQSVAKL